MELDHCKLFIGGISWDTDEDRLKEYFGKFGEVVEAVIMRDRVTGRARGFGFVVFSDSSIAERVILEKHMIDGRIVEAKKAVPKDDQMITTKIGNTVQGSPGPGRTKKIFVGGLPSTITETNFKNYFQKFGTVADVVVMYDHNTQRPRGFGFVTFDSEESVDRVLLKTFHQLHGKFVEVKRAVPKETPLGSSRNVRPNNNLSPNGVYPYGRLNPVSSARSSVLSEVYSITDGGRWNSNNVVSEGGSGPFYSNNIGPERASTPFHSNNIGSERALSPFYSTPIGYKSDVNDSVLRSPSWNLWGSGGLFCFNGLFNENREPVESSHDYEEQLHRNDSTWQSSSLDQILGFDPFGYKIGNSEDMIVKGTDDYTESYRGIAA